MTLKSINSHKEMLSSLIEKSKNYVLLYKKGSEASECSYKSIENALMEVEGVSIMSADVGTVRDIHTNYNISSAPSLMVFDGDKYIKTVKGCNDDSFYKSLFESSLFSAKADTKGKSQKRVTVYGTPSCSWCTVIKKHFDQHGIKYSYIDVSKDQKAAEAMVKKSGQQGVPQTDIGGQLIVGFDKNRINTLLGIQ